MKKKIIASKNWELPKFTTKEFFNKRSDYALCIPVLNEGIKLKKQLKKLKKYLSQVDVIICDWSSTDGSTNPAFLKSQGVRTILTKKSYGKQATQLRMGFAYALKQGYKGIIQVDGNNKDGMEAIPRFIEKLEQGYDYIQGSRYVKGGRGINTPKYRHYGVRYLITPIISISARRLLTDITNGFRAYSSKFLLVPKVKPFRNVFVSYSLNFYLPVRACQLKMKTTEIPVTRKYPKGNIPTKMSKFKGPLNLFIEVLKTALGVYNPEKI